MAKNSTKSSSIARLPRGQVSPKIGDSKINMAVASTPRKSPPPKSTSKSSNKK